MKLYLFWVYPTIHVYGTWRNGFSFSLSIYFHFWYFGANNFDFCDQQCRWVRKRTLSAPWSDVASVWTRGSLLKGWAGYIICSTLVEAWWKRQVPSRQRHVQKALYQWFETSEVSTDARIWAAIETLEGKVQATRFLARYYCVSQCFQEGSCAPTRARVPHTKRHEILARFGFVTQYVL